MPTFQFPFKNIPIDNPPEAARQIRRNFEAVPLSSPGIPYHLDDGTTTYDINGNAGSSTIHVKVTHDHGVTAGENTDLQLIDGGGVQIVTNNDFRVTTVGGAGGPSNIVLDNANGDCTVEGSDVILRSGVNGAAGNITLQATNGGSVSVSSTTLDVSITGRDVTHSATRNAFVLGSGVSVNAGGVVPGGSITGAHPCDILGIPVVIGASVYFDGKVPATGPVGAVNAKIPVYAGDGTTVVGYLPVYASIT